MNALQIGDVGAEGGRVTIHACTPINWIQKYLENHSFQKERANRREKKSLTKCESDREKYKFHE